MSFEDLGNVAELIAAIGVIVSLIYLGLQTKANTAAVSAQTRSNLTDQSINIQSLMFNNEFFLASHAKYRAGEPLNERENTILVREAMLSFKHMENAQFQFESGVYDVQEYEAQRRIWEQRFTVDGYWLNTWDKMAPVMSPRLVKQVAPIVEKVRSASSKQE